MGYCDEPSSVRELSRVIFSQHMIVNNYLYSNETIANYYYTYHIHEAARSATMQTKCSCLRNSTFVHIIRQCFKPNLYGNKKLNTAQAN